MDFFSAEFFSALFSIIIIDLVLAGDNAIVIGLAARNLPPKNQKAVIAWGTLGAVVIRAAATLMVVWLLRIPGLLLAGGLVLIWMAYKLLVEEKRHDVQSGATMWAAIRTIIIADAVMGIDNVLAVAGAAHGSFLMVVIGLLISVPIVVWGSTLVIKVIDRFPVIIYLGSAVIAYTAGKMITDEPFLKVFFEENNFLKWLLIILIIVGVIIAGRLKKQSDAKGSRLPNN
ncbi:MAG: TerC family protein [Desulfitobacteriaceae bacterium]